MTNNNTASTASATEANGTTQSMITDSQAQAFMDNGLLLVRQLLRGDELRLLQDSAMGLVETGTRNDNAGPDFKYGKGATSGKPVLRRVEYVVDKCAAVRTLLGNPFILRSVERLQGRNFIPTFDSMVLKMPNEGIAVPWHRDDMHPCGSSDPRPIFNVDFYLDDADLKSCLWMIPGSHLWPADKAEARCAGAEFRTDDAQPVPLQAGDVLFHNIMLLHGSPSGAGNALRRTIYFEFRPGEIERDFGPHNAAYRPLKQQILQACIDIRRQAPYARSETPFTYRPEGDFALRDTNPPTSYRVPHGDYWRT